MKLDKQRRWKMFVVAGAAMAFVAGMVSTVPSAYAGGTIKVDDDQYISLGMGIRTSFTSGEDRSASGGQWDNTFAVDNARVYINGGIHKYVKFTFNTECFNCSVNGGGTAGGPSGTNQFNGNSNMGLIDAIGKFEFSRTVNFWVGRTLVPTERGELNGPFYHQVYDGFRTPFNQSDISGGFGKGGAGAFGRDQGVVFFGKVDPGGTHVLYALSVFTGLQSAGGFGPNQRSTLKYAGRLQWNLLADEQANNPGYYTAGGYYGAYGDVLALAVSGEYQNQGAGSFANPSPYRTFIGDILYEKVMTDKGVFTWNAEYKRYWTQSLQAYADPDCFCMFNGTSFTTYALYLFPQEIGIGRFQPYVRYTFVNNVYQDGGGQDEYEGGMNYVISGFNARMSAFWRHDSGSGGPQNGAGFAPSGQLNASGTALNATGKHSDSLILALQMQY